METSDTSVMTCRLIRPSLSTTGVKLSEIPNFLKLTVWTHWPIAPAVVVWQVTPVGIGNSPPSMKVADSPEIAVRLGSARVRTTPALSIARMVALTEGLVPNDPVSALPETSGALLAVNGFELLKVTTELPTFRLADRSMPICLMIERATSATVTFSVTWSLPRTTIELTTLSAPPASRAARSPACCASIAVATRAGQQHTVADAVDLDIGARH